MDSNDSNTAPNGPTSASGTNGPGQALRAARTDLRLNPEDVANQLHLAPRQILALEADDYEQLPQPTYVRGYLRNYALFLGLSPQPILDAYNRAIAGRAPPKRTRERYTPAAEHEGQSKFGAIAVGGLILVLVIAWWQGREGDDTGHDGAIAPANSPPAGSGSVPADTAAATDARRTGDTPPAAMGPATPRAGADAAASSSAPSGNAAVPPRAPAGTSQALPAAPSSASPSASPETLANTSASAQTPPAAEARAAPPKPRPLPKNARPARLVLNASAESWVEVRDARGERLLYQTIPAGRIVGLEGMAPFRIFLGNAEGVAVAIDGEQYDASRHRRGTTARFSLNPPAAAPATPADAAPAADPSPETPAPAPSESNAPPLLPE